MEQKLREDITKLIAQSQDGRALNPNDSFSEFILERISQNTEGDSDDPASQIVNVETLIEDFNYMINQLQRALVPLNNL